MSRSRNLTPDAIEQIVSILMVGLKTDVDPLTLPSPAVYEEPTRQTRINMSGFMCVHTA